MKNLKLLASFLLLMSVLFVQSSFISINSSSVDGVAYAADTTLIPRGYLDAPVSYSNISGTFNVYGWYLDSAGVSKIEVLIDGAVKGQAVYGDLRTDVYNTYPAYGNKKMWVPLYFGHKNAW